MQIYNIHVKDIKPYSQNAKKHSEAQIKNVAESIKQFGFVQPIVLDKDKEIVIGHCRLSAAKLLGMECVPCYFVENLSKVQIKKLRNLDNKLNESEWDFDLLSLDIGGLNFDGFDIDWGIPNGTNDEYESKQQEFERKMKEGELSDDSEEYQEFLQKFEAKKTTDDCYTPKNIYESVVADYVVKEYRVEKKNFVRPFYPGGDYQNEKYKSTDIIVDNPPFSIISEIGRWYNKRDIKFFLFAPHLTCFAIKEAQKICCAVDIT